MIPYEELCASLIEWRSRQGLPTGQTDYLGAPMPMPLVGPPHPEVEQGPADEYDELADSEILSEEPAEFAAEGELGAADGYPGEEPVAFPDTDAVAVDEISGAEGDAFGEAQPGAESWDPEPAEPPVYGDEQPAADGWGEPQPEADGWGQARADAEAYAEAQPQADEWGEAQPEAPAWDEPAAPEGEAPAAGSYEGENEVTEFAPPPDDALADDREYADVMDEPAAVDMSGQTWDTEAEAEAVPPEGAGDAAAFEEARFETADAEPLDGSAGADAMAQPEAAEEGDSTMDVDPEDLLSADDLPPPLAEVGEIGGAEDPLAGPPPLEPPPEGSDPVVEELLPDEAVDPAAKPDPEQQ